MMGAAEGMKKGGDGGGAFQGAGIGLGFAMAGNMSGMMGNANAAQPQRAPAESKDQIMAMLKQLGELKAAGILTDTEFDTKKKELLAKL
jgi:membrane protease subunit (stomatin/prohibitin family)